MTNQPSTITHLLPFELTVLREVAKPNTQPNLHYGTAVTQALTFLYNSGYITLEPAVGAGYTITPAGQAYLKDHADV